ncbi:hypothetical protein ACHAW5_000674 [Stephanodiscus triporus]|uniref:Uncharacterized protein n=1 Tax=Stephanodiscus triporus TaxID=2934178 RepID=A0ABD3NC83_9STRA
MEVAHKKTIESEGVEKHVFPTQSRRVQHNEISSVPNALVLPPCYGIVGHPSLKIYRFQLPGNLHPLLDHIVEGCANYANSLPSGWRTVTHWLFYILLFISLSVFRTKSLLRTYLYSLTKQDVALRDVPGMYEVARPIMHYIKRAIER